MNQVIQITMSTQELQEIISNAVREAVKAPLQEFERRMNGGLMEPKEVQAMLKVSYPTVKAMWLRGDLDMVLVNNRPKVTRESVTKIVNK